MKAITVTQPRATLVAIGVKKIETRSWATAYRGPLAIHAAKGLRAVGGKDGLYTLCMQSPFREALHDAGDMLPLGAIVATCNLVSVHRIDPDQRWFGSGLCGPIRFWELTDQERAFGDYTPGRYAWLLADVKMLPEPIPAKGALGLWEWDGRG